MRGDAKSVTTGFQNYMLYDKLPDEYHSVDESEKDESETTNHELKRNKQIETQFADTEWIDLGGLPCVGDGRAEIKRMAFVLADSMQSVRNVQGNEQVILLLDIQIKARIDKPQVGIVLYNRQGLPAIHTNNEICGTDLEYLSKGEQLVAEFKFNLPSLANGNYIFTVGIQSGMEMPQKIEDAYEFCVSRLDVKGTQCGYVIVENESFSLSQKCC